MWFFNQPSSAARMALIYITVGALAVIWSGVWYVYLYNHPPERSSVYYWCGGFMVTGVTLILIGLGLGRIGRAAQRADLPPQSVPHPADLEGPTQVMVPGQPVSTVNTPAGPGVVTGPASGASAGRVSNVK
jgi:hypothetical protein